MFPVFILKAHQELKALALFINSRLKKTTQYCRGPRKKQQRENPMSFPTSIFLEKNHNMITNKLGICMCWEIQSRDYCRNQGISTQNFCLKPSMSMLREHSTETHNYNKVKLSFMSFHLYWSTWSVNRRGKHATGNACSISYINSIVVFNLAKLPQIVTDTAQLCVWSADDQSRKHIFTRPGGSNKKELKCSCPESYCTAVPQLPYKPNILKILNIITKTF